MTNKTKPPTPHGQFDPTQKKYATRRGKEFPAVQGSWGVTHTGGGHPYDPDHGRRVLHEAGMDICLDTVNLDDDLAEKDT